MRPGTLVERGTCGSRWHAWRRRASYGLPIDRLLFRLASVYYDLQQYDLAQDYAQEALRLAPSEWLYHYLSGLIATLPGSGRRLATSLETAARLNASAAEVQNALGEVSQHEGDLRGAVAAFQRAVELKPDEPAYRLNLEAARKK